MPRDSFGAEQQRQRQRQREKAAPGEGVPKLTHVFPPGTITHRLRLCRIMSPVLDPAAPLSTEAELAALAVAIAGESSVSERGGSADPRRRLFPTVDFVHETVREIAGGGDPLGDCFCRLRPARIRRRMGAVYTPMQIVRSMTAWAATEGVPSRIVDPGAGSGRFLLAAGRTFPNAELIAVESDPLAALLLRANAAALGMAGRLTVLRCDYRTIDLPDIPGRTLFVGNPPWVRHHDIPPSDKDWLVGTARALGLKASRLAGLHVHFLLKTCRLARPDDFGAFITSAEWLDVNYGDVLRKAFVHVLGGMAIHVLDPTTTPFPGAEATGAISCFRVGSTRASVRFRAVGTPESLGTLEGGRPVSRARLAAMRRWSSLLRPVRRTPGEFIELGELCRVHRGQVTGCNAVWIAGNYSGVLPQSVLIPSVTRARELFAAAPTLSSAQPLRRVVDLPVNLDDLEEGARLQVHEFLRWARSMSAHRSSVASTRRAWWAVGLRRPAPLLCTYMARRPPTFVRNACGARHLNIAHGLYPRQSMEGRVLDALAQWLRRNVGVSGGRTYAGGLTKYEPGEIERIAIPPLEWLHEAATTLDRG